MGRRKIKIQPIHNERNRQVTFLKRKHGLMKKAYELSVLCDCQVALLISEPNNKLSQYASHDMAELMQRFKQHTGRIDSKTNRDFDSSSYQATDEEETEAGCDEEGRWTRSPTSSIKNNDAEMSLPVCTMGVLVPPSPPSAELLMQPQDDARLRQEATAVHHASEMGFADASAMVTPPPSNNHSSVNNIQPPPTTSSTSTPPLRMATHPLTWLPFQTVREKETKTSMAPPPVMAPPACATTMAISPSASSTLSSSSLSSNASFSSSLTPGAVIHAASLSASSTNTQIQPKNGYMTPFNESAYTTAPLLSSTTVMSPLWGHVATDLAANTTNTPPSASSAFPFMSEAPPPTFPIIMDAWSPSASVFSLDHRLSW